MAVKDHSDIEKFNLPGLEHQTLAGAGDGLKTMEMWMQTIEAGAATPVHRHDCEEVIVVIRGQGVCKFGDREEALGPETTLIVAPNEVHQVCNTGGEDMFVVAALAMAPVRVETPEGEVIDLPW